jgi:hypothetical protein
MKLQTYDQGWEYGLKITTTMAIGDIFIVCEGDFLDGFWDALIERGDEVLLNTMESLWRIYETLIASGVPDGTITAK